MKTKFWVAGLGIVVLALGLLVALPGIGNRELEAATVIVDTGDPAFGGLRADEWEELNPDAFGWAASTVSVGTSNDAYGGLRADEWEELNPDAFGWAVSTVSVGTSNDVYGALRGNK